MRNMLYLLVIAVLSGVLGCQGEGILGPPAGDADVDGDSDGDSDGDADDDDDDDDDDDNVGCTDCHGFPPNVGEHEEHDDYTCSTCHGAVVNSSDLIIDSVLHVDGEPDVTPGSGTYNPSTGACSNTGCHGTEWWD